MDNARIINLSSDYTEGEFKLASLYINSNKDLKFDNQTKLELYAIYKQATEGDCKSDKPGIFDPTGRAKWTSWNLLQGISQVEARNKYVEYVNTVEPTWLTFFQKNKKEGENEDESSEYETDTDASDDKEDFLDKSESNQNSKQEMSLGLKVSTLQKNKIETVEDNVLRKKAIQEKDCFFFCKENMVSELTASLDKDEAEIDINAVDEKGLTLLHWACDRGYLEVVKNLLARKIDVNKQDNSQQTALHYAVCCGHIEVVTYMLGWAQSLDVNIKNSHGETARETADSEEMIEVFGRLLS